MNFDQMFLEISLDKEQEIKSQIKTFFKGDTQYLSLKKKAMKSSRAVPDFLDYIHTTYEKEIDNISKKYKIDYDEIAGLFLEV